MCQTLGKFSSFIWQAYIPFMPLKEPMQDHVDNSSIAVQVTETTSHPFMPPQ